MKKKILGLVTIAILLLSSCSDFLDEVAYDKFQKEDALSNPTLVYINSVDYKEPALSFVHTLTPFYQNSHRI